MVLTNKQEEGLKCAVRKYLNGDPYTVISGYAGSGKSTLIKFIIEALDINSENVAYIAYTGKAAEVLRRKGCPNACTAHHLLFYSSKTVDGKFIFKPKKDIGNFKLLVVDEVSMLPKDLWELLLSHRIPILACGDPGQLPPIDKDNALNILDNPDIFLDEIMRQAQESEIIRLSMAIRNNEDLSYWKGKETQVIPYSEVVTGMYDWADQILVATNDLRRKINTEIRSMHKLNDTPNIGDKIICLTNKWNILDSTMESALVNGTIGYIDNCTIQRIKYPINKNFIIGPISTYNINFTNEIGENFEDICVDKTYIDTHGEQFSLTPKQEYWIYKKQQMLPSAPITFDYGYAITVHRAQGSEWDKVLIFEERFPFNKEEHTRWLYTAVTRASEKLVLVR